MPASTPRSTARAGFTLIELVAAAAVLAAAGVMTVEIVVWSRAATRAIDEERLAWHKASNCLELLSAEGYETVTPRRAAECRLPEASRAALTAGELSVTVTPLDEFPRRKRITAELSWEAGPAQPRRVVRLTTFLHSPGDRPKSAKGEGP